MQIMVVIAVLIVAILGYILCLRTYTGRQERLNVFTKVLIAHRGLFDNDKECPENSKIAFEYAVESGFGIELDVQLTKDGQLVVFHDESLKRMCGAEKKITECTYEELQEYSLLKSNQKIPRFSEVLSIIEGKVPLIVEIKTEGEYIELCEKTAAQLSEYKGEYCIESFNPMAVAWFRKYYPHIIRGQLSTDYRKDNIGRNVIETFLLTNLLLNFYAKPDFIAYNHKYKNQFSYMVCKFFYKPVRVAWTIRNMTELDKALEDFDIVIFDSFIPDSIL